MLQLHYGNTSESSLYVITSSDYTRIGCDQALRDLSQLIQEGGRWLSEYGLPEPENLSWDTLAEIEAFEPRQTELQQIANNAYWILTDEQRQAFDEIHGYIIRHPSHCDSSPLFLEGKPGRGKSFVICAALASLRSEGRVLLIVGTTALAVQQYECGCTTHHMFRLPVNEVSAHLWIICTNWDMVCGG